MCVFVVTVSCWWAVSTAVGLLEKVRVVGSVPVVMRWGGGEGGGERGWLAWGLQRSGYGDGYNDAYNDAYRDA